MQFLFNKPSPFLLLLTALAILPACGKRTPKGFMPFKKVTLQEKSGIEAKIAPLTPKETKRCTGHSLRSYQAVHLSLYNKTAQSFFVNGSAIDLPLESIKKVSRSVHYNIATRTIWAAGNLALTATSLIEGKRRNSALMDLVSSGFSVADIASKIDLNKQIDREFSRLSLDHESQFELRPYSILTKIFFVPIRAYNPLFSVAITDQTTGKPVLFSLPQEESLQTLTSFKAQKEHNLHESSQIHQ